ncbi:hypothetical protein QL285_027192 [Trifolium repens]|nr:hypothetical protein QL285_027192 [Trifolium repens]
MSSVSSCRALTFLNLHGYHKSCDGFKKRLYLKFLNFSALTNLDLVKFTFCANDNVDCAEPLSTFNSLQGYNRKPYSLFLQEDHQRSLSDSRSITLDNLLRLPNIAPFLSKERTNPLIIVPLAI